jgi:phosphopantothenoylcysteine decarboxylase/phosphopantothenate--cysteine ligase
MSNASQCIIHPNVMEFATGKKVITGITGKLEHLQEFDLVLIAPATANTISKIACGIADSAITSLVLSSKAKVLIAPAMSLEMYTSKILGENIRKLEAHGYKVIKPRQEEGKAKLASVSEIVDSVIYELHKKDFKGKKVVVTGGPTIEYIDPVRIITNKSSGKMGIAIAKEAYFRGADVKLVYGPGKEEPPKYLPSIKVERGKEMLSAVQDEMPCDVFISAAAISDFTTKSEKRKIESDKGITLELVPVPKILDKIKCFKVGFKSLYNVSKEELLDVAFKSLNKYQLDIVVANDVSKNIFGCEESEVYILDGKAEFISRRSKYEIAARLLDKIKEKIK